MRGRTKNLTGLKFGRLTALRPTDRREPTNGCTFWECRCDCGNIHLVNSNNLQTGAVQSCGCSKYKEET